MSHETKDMGRVTVQYFADICYIGQAHHIEVPFELRVDTLLQLREVFTQAYKRVFGHSPGTAEKIVNLRAIHRLEPEIGDMAPTSMTNGSDPAKRSEEHTSELQSLMRISYAVFCLKKKNNKHINMYIMHHPIYTPSYTLTTHRKDNN